MRTCQFRGAALDRGGVLFAPQGVFVCHILIFLQWLQGDSLINKRMANQMRCEAD